MSKHEDQSGKENFLIGLSKQTKGSDGFIPSGYHNHKKFWYVVIGVIVVIVLFIFGANIFGSHQSKPKPAHHAKTTRVTKKPAHHKHHKDKAKKNHKKSKAEQAKKEAEQKKRTAAKKAAAQKRAAKRQAKTASKSKGQANYTQTARVTPQRQTTTNVRPAATQHANVQTNQR